MPITYALDHANGVIVTTWTGRVTIGDQVRHWHALLDDPQAMALKRSLVDMRAGTPAFTGAEVRDALPELQRRLGGVRWVIAIVVADAVQFGVSRQFEVLASTVTDDEIFEDPDAALRWLVAQRT